MLSGCMICRVAHFWEQCEPECRHAKLWAVRGTVTLSALLCHAAWGSTLGKQLTRVTMLQEEAGELHCIHPTTGGGWVPRLRRVLLHSRRCRSDVWQRNRLALLVALHLSGRLLLADDRGLGVLCFHLLHDALLEAPSLHAHRAMCRALLCLCPGRDPRPCSHARWIGTSCLACESLQVQLYRRQVCVHAGAHVLLRCPVVHPAGHRHVVRHRLQAPCQNWLDHVPRGLWQRAVLGGV